MTATALELQGVCKSYGTIQALDDVTLSLSSGTVTGLLGPNGAGKSTLFQLIVGLYAPDRGQVRVFGRTHGEDGPGILSRLGVVFQSRAIDLDMSIAANLRFHGRLHGLGGRTLSGRIDELAAQFGLEDKLDRPARALSGGQQRRVEIARALLHHPDLLIMDEPTAGLDTPARADLVAHVQGLPLLGGTAILWATHLVDEVADADRIIVLSEGRIAADGSPADLTRRAQADDLIGAYRTLSRPSPVSRA